MKMYCGGGAACPAPSVSDEEEDGEEEWET